MLMKIIGLGRYLRKGISLAASIWPQRTYLWQVMVPLAAPTLISITILKFMGTWNAYVWPQLVARDEWTLISVGLRGSAFTNIDLGIVEYGYRMAASFVVTVPLFLLFIFFRKYIMRGVGRAGIKG